MTETAPDGFEPLFGTRAWVYACDSGELRSLTRVTVWPHGRLDAQCWTRLAVPIGRHHPTQTPDAHCQCGIYAMTGTAIRNRMMYSLPPGVVCGVVAGWGKVVIHESGWRAQYARPVGLFREAAGGGFWAESQTLEAASRYGLAVLPIDWDSIPIDLPDNKCSDLPWCVACRNANMGFRLAKLAEDERVMEWARSQWYDQNVAATK